MPAVTFDDIQAPEAQQGSNVVTFDDIKPQPGYTGNLGQMASQGAMQLGRGAAQLANAFDFASSGAGRNTVPDTPANRVAGGFSALDPSAPQAPLTESEHRAANREAIGNVVSGVGNVIQGGLDAAFSPVNAGLRTFIGQPVENATGIPKEYTELAAGLVLPSAVGRTVNAAGRAISAAPSVERLTAAATAGFQSPVVQGLEVASAPVTAWSQGVRNALTNSGLGDQLATRTHAILGQLDHAPAGATVTGNNFSALRQNLANLAQEIDPITRRPTQDAAAATRAVRSLDGFIARGIRPADVLAGDAAQAAQLWGEARGNYSAAMKARQMDAIQFRAELRASAANSGMNLDNTLRQRAADILADPSRRRGFNEGELALMQRLVEGTGTRNTLRTAGNVMGGGGGLGSIVAAGAGGYATGGPGALLPVVGFAFKKMENVLAARDMDHLNTLIRGNSPLARQMRGPLQDFGTRMQAFEVSPTPRTLAAVTLASRNLANNLRDAGIAIAPNELLLRSIQGPMRAPAQDEQPESDRVVNQ